MINVDFQFDLGSLRAPLHALPAKVDRLIDGAVIRQEGISTGYMKSHAPWTDRSGDARNSLHAQYSREGDTRVLTLAHGMPYGIWLELRYAGRYAIILQSMQQAGRDIMSLLDKGLSRL